MTPYLPSLLGLTDPVFWYVPNKSGYSREIDVPDYQYALNSGLGIFLAVNQHGDARNPNGNRRHSGNATRATAFFVDFDTGTKPEQLARLAEFSLPYSVLVESGRGYHAYWILSVDDTVDWRTWSYIQSALAAHFGADSACCDPSRLMRLPGSYHTKGEPVLVTLTVNNPLKYYYSAEFTALFPVPAPRVFALSDQRTPTATPRLPSVRLSAGDRHPTLIRMTARMFRGVLPSEVYSRTIALRAWYATSCVPLKDSWEDEVDDAIAWVLSRENVC